MAWSSSDFSTRLGKLFGYQNSVKTQVSALYNANLTSIFTTFASTSDRASVGNLADLSIPERGLPSSIGSNTYGYEYQHPILRRGLRSPGDWRVRRHGAHGPAGSVLAVDCGQRHLSLSRNQQHFLSATAGNQGNGTACWCVGIARHLSTVFLQEMFTESIGLRCIEGGTVGNFGQGNFQLTGVASLPSNNTEWPSGSDTSLQVQATSAAVTASVGTPGVSAAGERRLRELDEQHPRGLDDCHRHGWHAGASRHDAGPWLVLAPVHRRRCDPHPYPPADCIRQWCPHAGVR
jgi:hypothetical protein